METDVEMAERLERIAEWNAHLRPCEQDDLRQAAARLRTVGAVGVGVAPAVPAMRIGSLTDSAPINGNH